MFVAVCYADDGKAVYIKLKLDPGEGDYLRSQYDDIIPGYYMNKVNWNSVKADGNVPEELLQTLLDKSYELVLAGFSKKKLLTGEEYENRIDTWAKPQRQYLPYRQNAGR